MAESTPTIQNVDITDALEADGVEVDARSIVAARAMCKGLGHTLQPWDMQAQIRKDAGS